MGRPHTQLSALNRELIEFVCGYLGIPTKVSNSWDYQSTGGKSAVLVDLCAQSGATEYISGPAARSYLDEKLFIEKNIKVTWFEYSAYPEYPQLWGEFVHAVTVLDLLFNCGRESYQYMKHVKPAVNPVQTMGFRRHDLPAK